MYDVCTENTVFPELTEQSKCTQNLLPAWRVDIKRVYQSWKLLVNLTSSSTSGHVVCSFDVAETTADYDHYDHVLQTMFISLLFFCKIVFRLLQAVFKQTLIQFITNLYFNTMRLDLWRLRV